MSCTGAFEQHVAMVEYQINDLEAWIRNHPKASDRGKKYALLHCQEMLIQLAYARHAVESK